ncbi:MAG: nitrous oxide-stimulated promoter family protein, partial [Rikenellaceae bacterium]
MKNNNMTRIEQEKQTVARMIEIYCRSHHKTSALCTECRGLAEYTNSRLDHCLFGKKRVYNKCTIHCYKLEYLTLPAQKVGTEKTLPLSIMGVKHYDKQFKERA